MAFCRHAARNLLRQLAAPRGHDEWSRVPRGDVLWQVAGMMLDIGYTVEKSYLQVPRCARSSEFRNLAFPLKLS